MKKLLFLLVAINLYSCDPIRKLYVKFGDSKPVLENKQDAVIRIFFDRQGAIYPDIPIKDSKIEEADSRLAYLFKTDNPTFLAACCSVGLRAGATPEQLQQKIVDQKAALLNAVNPNVELVFLIHGFNKHPLQYTLYSAFDEYTLLRQKIVSNYPGKAFQFVEIYWDGCTWVNGKRKRENQNSFKIWDNAQAASNLVALELRRILYQVQRLNTYVITHSLGAGVITCALFNADKFNLSNEDTKFKKKILKLYGNANLYKTPTTNFKVGMLAPAIPGTNTFEDYYKRVPTSETRMNNFSFVVGYNIHDEALIKRVGIPTLFGATTLGCLPTEVTAVETMRNTVSTTIIYHENFSNNGLTPQVSHALTDYIGNSVPMNSFLKLLFE